MEITLEKIELVKDRTGVSYREAKEALEASEGSVVDAIIAIEDKINSTDDEKSSKVQDVVANIKEAVKKGNVNKLTIKKNDNILLNLPLNVGILGTVLFPWAGLAAAIAAFGTHCDITLTKDDGSVIDISGKAASSFESVKTKGGVIFDEAVDKGKEIYEKAKDKGGDAYEFAKDKGSEFMDFAKDKSAGIFDFAKDKYAQFTKKDADNAETAEEVCETVSEAAEEIKETVEDAAAETAEAFEEIKEAAEEAVKTE